jgi:acetyl-CoA acetyltransferase
MRRYLHESQAPADALAGFSVVAHENGVHNPMAMYRKAIRREDYARAARLSDAVNLFDAAPLADGAAALLLVQAERLPRRRTRQIVIAASSWSHLWPCTRRIRLAGGGSGIGASLLAGRSSRKTSTSSVMTPSPSSLPRLKPPDSRRT